MENVLTFYIISSAVTFAVNIPCGYIRESYAKFSGRWFLWQYAALTLIILLHINFGAAKIFIPVYFILAAMGQRIGTNAKKKRLTKNEIERLEQIPDLHVNKKYPAKIDDHDVMIVLLNMGGPATNQDIPAFLKKVFNDPLLIRFPLSKILQPLFAWALVTFRAKATQERYQLIGGGTPLYASTQAQVQELKAELARRGRHIEVTYSFNYT